jgi:hypothetical protein
MTAVILASITDRDGDTIAFVKHANGTLGFISASPGGAAASAVLADDVDELASFATTVQIAATVDLGGKS